MQYNFKGGKYQFLEKIQFDYKQSHITNESLRNQEFEVPGKKFSNN